MIQFLKNFSQFIVLSVLFLGNIIIASEVPDQEKSSFSLPNDLTKWQETTNRYMEPVLTTETLKNHWQKLVDLTMPTHGNFNPTTNITRREATIIQARDA